MYLLHSQLLLRLLFQLLPSSFLPASFCPILLALNKKFDIHCLVFQTNSETNKHGQNRHSYPYLTPTSSLIHILPLTVGTKNHLFLIHQCSTSTTHLLLAFLTSENTNQLLYFLLKLDINAQPASTSLTKTIRSLQADFLGGILSRRD